MRIQAPHEWAHRSLAACDEGGPFVAVFDAQAQATVTESQGAHLMAHSGLAIEAIPDVIQPAETPPEAPKRSHKAKPKPKED